MSFCGKQISITVYTLSELKDMYEQAKKVSAKETPTYESAYKKAVEIIKGDIILNRASNKIEKALQKILLESSFDNAGLEDAYTFKYYLKHGFVFQGKYNCYKFIENKFKADKDIWEVIENCCCETNKFLVHINKDSSSTKKPFVNLTKIFDRYRAEQDYDSYYLYDVEEKITDYIWDKISDITRELIQLNHKLINPSDEVLIEYAAGKYFPAQIESWYKE